MNIIKNNNGITLMALIITIIILIILAGVSFTEGNNLIKKTKTESVMTNMITIKAKAKVYAEEVNSKVWDLSSEQKAGKREELFLSEYKMSKIENLSNNAIEGHIDTEVKESEYEVYSITKDTLAKMGLSDIDSGENYAIVYNAGDYTKLDVIYLTGIKCDNEVCYTLSKLQSKIGE